MEWRASTLDRKSWDARVSGAGGALPQCWDWGAACGRPVRRIELIEAGRAVALAQVVLRPLGFGRSVGLVSRGPVILEGGADPRRALAALRGLGPMIVTPPGALELPVAQALPLMTGASVAVWDLAAPEPDLRAGLYPKRRNRLARTERLGLKIGRAGDLGWLIAREEENRAARRYRGLPGDFVARLCRAPGSHMILTARDRGEVLAGGLFLVHGAGATYQIGWSGEAGRRAGAMGLILWQAALRLKARGVTTLDLGTLDTDDAPGLARFKLETGAKVVRLGRAMLLWPGGAKGCRAAA